MRAEELEIGAFFRGRVGRGAPHYMAVIDNRQNGPIVFDYALRGVLRNTPRVLDYYGQLNQRALDFLSTLDPESQTYTLKRVVRAVRPMYRFFTPVNETAHL